ncbi:MAG: hypothetical protein SWZ49_22720 [Cyanobacteriota bacterium]|nr:hypothetical protein [Cyanobacteriota bacterium]
MQGTVRENLTPNLVIAGLEIAFLFGTGRGKTMLTAYLIGSQATAKQAILLGLVATIAHTASIYVLGILALFASQSIIPEQLYPVLSLISGFTISGVCFWLLTNQFEHCEHSHHHHIPEESITTSFLIALGIAGGITPANVRQR